MNQLGSSRTLNHPSKHDRYAFIQRCESCGMGHVSSFAGGIIICREGRKKGTFTGKSFVLYAGDYENDVKNGKGEASFENDYKSDAVI